MSSRFFERFLQKARPQFNIFYKRSSALLVRVTDSLYSKMNTSAVCQIRFPPKRRKELRFLGSLHKKTPAPAETAA